VLNTLKKTSATADSDSAHATPPRVSFAPPRGAWSQSDIDESDGEDAGATAAAVTPVSRFHSPEADANSEPRVVDMEDQDVDAGFDSPVASRRSLQREATRRLSAEIAANDATQWRDRVEKDAANSEARQRVMRLASRKGTPTEAASLPPPSPPTSPPTSPLKAEPSCRESSCRLSRASMPPVLKHAASSFKRRAEIAGEGVKQTGKKTVETTRDRHTVVSVTHPLDINVADPLHLSDEQMVQIFFSALVWELVMGCVWANAVTIGAGGSINILNMMIVGFSTAITQIIVVLVTRAIFRVANHRLHVGLKSPWARVRRKARFVYGFCWFLNLFMFAAMCWITIAYATCFGDNQTHDMFFGWGYALGISWIVTEPLIIIFFTVLPGLCRCDALGGCLDRMDEMGVNAELFIGAPFRVGPER
jgi:hypothetical protein